MPSYNPFIDPVGNDDACAWRSNAGGIIVQIENPQLARRLQRSGVKLELTGTRVLGGYLRLYWIKGKSLSWFKRWLSRSQTPD